MTARTDPTAVKNILQGEYQVGVDLTPFIETASMMVDQLHAEDSVTPLMNAASLEIVERWLSAHFYQMADPGYTQRTTGGASGSFTGQQGQGFTSTRYGQMAMRLDATGYLARREREMDTLGKRMVQAVWLGNDCE